MGRGRRILGAIALAAGLAALVPAAVAAQFPSIEATYVTDVTATSAFLRTEIDPGGTAATYRFEYLSAAAYRSNLESNPPKEGFSGAAKAPLSGSSTVKAGVLSQHVFGLAPQTLYRYRARAANSEATTIGPERLLQTEAPTNGFALPDNRGWEMVSPVDKNGGAISPPEAIFGGGVFQAAATASSFTYSAADSFGDGDGAPPGSQYMATRDGSGWASENITTPAVSGSYGETPDGVPYQLFSTDLGRGLLSNGVRCRGQVGECPVLNPPLPGSGAPEGYRDYYLRDASGGFAALLTGADLSHTPLGPEQLEVALAGATPDLSHVVLSSCAALSADASEVPTPEGCDPAAQNLYQWSGAGLEALNVLPGDTQTTPGALLAAPTGAISTDCARVYFSLAEDGPIYIHEAGGARLVPETTGGGAAFQTASADGRLAYFTKGATLYRYDSELDASAPIAAGVTGVLGASADGSRLYYQDGGGLRFRDGGETTLVAAGADAALPSDFPPATGTARISADGLHLLFLSDAELGPFDNLDALTGQPDAEAYLWGPPPGGGEPALTCVSCNPTGERPQGSAQVPGAVANGQAPAATRVYKPRALAADGNRVLFTTEDKLLVADSNKDRDVYEWEARGVGDCDREGGCTALISSGHGEGPAVFLDASASGSDVFFLTDASLAYGDPGSNDVYDAREGGGFPVPSNTTPCLADACQPLPSPPDDPTPGTLVPNAGNPARRYLRARPGRHRKKKRHRGRSKWI